MASPTTPTKAAAPTSYTSTPVKKNLQGSEHFASLNKPDVTLLQKNMATELAGHWVGPMPVDKFITTFLPNSGKKPNFDPKFFAVLKVKELEKDMYDPFIEHVTERAPDVIDGFQLVNPSKYDDPDIVIPGMKNKPDVSCYKADVVVDPAHPTRYEDMELIFEFKTKDTETDPFEDYPSEDESEQAISFPFEPQAQLRNLCRGQIASYARVWTARQHRTHCFIIWITNSYARIIRFDRSGGIVSERFNYRDNGHLLLNFLWHFSHSTDHLRGLDETVTKASAAEKKEAEDKLYQWKPKSNRSVFKMKVPYPDATSGKTRPFLVLGPLSDPRSVTGRATRGYAAWDPQDRQVVFLKDSWRSSEPGMEKEVDILRELNAKECRNVPDVLCGDDLDQATLTKQYAKEHWNIGAKEEDLVQRVHTRFVEKNVGSHITSDLKEMNPRKFLQVVFDAFIAHYDAYTKCGILHRDISAGNILVDKHGRGFLNDWDLSRHINGDINARQAFRSGTWQFMSAPLLLNPTKLNTLQDDMESFFWLVLYHILRYMSHSRLEGLAELMQTIFDSQSPVPLGAQPRGGAHKNLLLSTGDPLTLDFEVDRNPALTTFYQDARSLWMFWNSHIQYHKLVVSRYKSTHGVSAEVAAEENPLKTEHLAMHNHEALIKLFEDALARDAQWAAGDFFVDHLSRDANKHGRDEDAKDGSGNGGENAAQGDGAARPAKNLKRQTKLNEVESHDA